MLKLKIHWKVDHKYLENGDMWCWRRIKKISWTNRMKNEVLQRVKEERNILQTVKCRKLNWIGHILCRDCLPKQVIERKKEARIEVTVRQGGRCTKLLDDLKEKIRYWKLKEEPLNHTL